MARIWYTTGRPKESPSSNNTSSKKNIGVNSAFARPTPIEKTRNSYSGSMHNFPTSKPAKTRAKPVTCSADGQKITLPGSKPVEAKGCVSRKSHQEPANALETPQIIISSPPSPATQCAPNPLSPITPTKNPHLLAPSKEISSKRKRVQPVELATTLKLTSTSSPAKRTRGRPRVRFADNKNIRKINSLQNPATAQSRSPRPQLTNPCSSTLSSPTLSHLQQKQAVTINLDGDLVPKYCSEEPRLFNGNSLVESLLTLDDTPKLPHSEPIRPCANRAAHQDPDQPYGYGVCSTCRTHAHRHIIDTTPELMGVNWWPLCCACGEEALADARSGTMGTNVKMGCSCGREWLCSMCRIQEMEIVKTKSEVEAQFRWGIVGVGVVDGTEKIVLPGWIVRYFSSSLSPKSYCISRCGSKSTPTTVSRLSHHLKEEMLSWRIHSVSVGKTWGEALP
ncbi:hypothetical protein MMC28_003115 [Mycoblastus sanguinarius]|nr:hypothetical protein [Mycoblastus sanguinarius]